MGIKQLRQKKADLVAQMKGVQGKLGAADLTDEQRAAALAEFKGLEAQYDANEELLGLAERQAARERTLTPVIDPDAAAAAAATTDTVVRTIADEQDKKAKAPGFFGRQLQAVRNIALREASAEDVRIAKMMAGPTGLNTDVPSEGGFLVSQAHSSTIMQRAYATGEILSLITPMPIDANSNGMTFPAIDETSRANGSRFGGIVSGWIGQGNTLSAGKPKFRQMNLKLRKVAGFLYGTDELLADASALEAWVNRYLPLELMFRTEDAVVNGDGSNQPVGILNSGAAITVTRNTATRVLYEDVSGMWKRMWAPLRKRAVWLVDQSVEQELEALSIAIGTAGVLAPIYKPAGIAVGPDGTQGYSPATLYGRPILTTEYGAALGTVGDIVLANFDEYTLIDKGGVNQAVSLHVAFLTDEAVYRFIYRCDGQLNWNAALTPKSGGATLSPVVTLT